MNRLSARQLASAALITDAFALFCISGGISAVTAVGMLAGILVQFLALLPVLRSAPARWGRLSGSVLTIILTGCGGVLFAELWRTSGVVYIPWESSGMTGELLVGGALAAVCLYVTSGGLRTLGRCAAAAAAFGGICLLGLMISAAVTSDWRNLAEKRTAAEFPQEFLRGLSLSGGTAVFAAMHHRTGESSGKAAARYFGGKAILSAAVVLTAVLVAGGIMELARFPVITAAQLSQPFTSQRIDSLFLMAFSASAVFGGAALAAPAAELAGEIFPAVKKFSSPAVLGAMLAVGEVFRRWEKAAECFSLAVPALLLILGVSRLSGRRAAA